jgi:hypothetical protein
VRDVPVLAPAQEEGDNLYHMPAGIVGKGAISSAEAWRRRVKSPITKGLGGEREGFRRGGPLVFPNAKSGVT